MSSRRGHGLIQSRPYRVAHRVGAEHHPGIRQALGAGIPAASLAQWAPAVLDQGPSETCFAHAFGCAIYTAFGAAGKALSFVPSPLEIASCTYADVRALVNPTGGLPPLVDTGAENQDVADAIRRWGVCPIQAPTSDGRYSDVPSSLMPFPEPVVSRLQTSKLLQGEYSIPVDSYAAQLTVAAIVAGIPCVVGFLAGPAFDAATIGGVVGPDTIGAGHDVVIDSFRTTALGALEFGGPNSYGVGWCDRGRFWAAEAWLRATWSIWPMAVVAP